jgi:hypothetical protein
MSLIRSLITDQHRPILGQPPANRFATGTGGIGDADRDVFAQTGKPVHQTEDWIVFHDAVHYARNIWLLKAHQQSGLLLSETGVFNGERDCVRQSELDAHLVRIVVTHILQEITASADGFVFVSVAHRGLLRSARLSLALPQRSTGQPFRPGFFQLGFMLRVVLFRLFLPLDQGLDLLLWYLTSARRFLYPGIEHVDGRLELPPSSSVP